MAVSLRNLVYSWRENSQPLLQVAEFSVAPGEKVLVQGPSGSGKSTLLGIVGGVLTPQAGWVEVLGTELTQISGGERDRFRADHMGFIFQIFNLIPYLSVIENITLPLSYSALRRKKVQTTHLSPRNEARRLMKALNIQNLERQPVTDLSVGQQQRVAAARALVGSPELIIADEPTSALDADSRSDFLSLLFKECERANSTLIYVSHESGLKSHFDKVRYMTDLNASPTEQACLL